MDNIDQKSLFRASMVGVTPTMLGEGIQALQQARQEGLGDASTVVKIMDAVGWALAPDAVVYDLKNAYIKIASLQLRCETLNQCYESMKFIADDLRSSRDGDLKSQKIERSYYETRIADLENELRKVSV